MILKDVLKILPESFRKRSVPVALSIFFRALLDFASVAVLVPVLVKLLEEGSSPRDVLPLALAALGFIVFKGVIIILLTQYRSRFVFSLYSALSESMLRAFLSKGLLFIRRSNSVDLSNKVNAVTMAFISGVILSLLNALSSAFLLLIILAALLLYDPVATSLVFLIMGPLVFMYSYFLRKKMKNLGAEENLARRDQVRSVMEFFRGYSDYRMNGAEAYQMSKFRSSVNRVSEVRLKLESYSAASSGFMEISVILMIIIIMLFSFSSGWKLSLTFGIFALAAIKILPAVRAIVGSWQTYQASSYSADILKEVLSGDACVGKGVDKEDVAFNESIELRDVSFSYPDSDSPLFEGLQLHVSKGDYVGIKGHSGIGKTTIFNLLMGLYEPSDGGLYVDGVKITAENAASWQSMIGYVPQDVFLVNASFVENVALGQDDSEVDRSRVHEMLSKVGLCDWVDSLPQGMDTLLAEAGNSISGGQKQRIGIARALYKGASVLFFDEATSSVDTQAESEINSFISELSRQNPGLTVLVIAHRQETLAACRRVVDLSGFQGICQ